MDLLLWTVSFRKWGKFMDKKLTYVMFAIIGAVIFPVKLMVELINPQMVKTTWFMVFYAVFVFLMMVVSSKSKAMIEEKPVPKNILLAFISFLCALGCGWASYYYFTSEKPKDLKVQYTLLSVFCALSVLFFFYVCYSHVSGNNPFKNIQVLLFSAPIMYLSLLAVFFSYEIGKHDVYNVVSKGLTVLFFVYYSQNYVSIPDIGYKRKRMITFGLPASLISFGYFIPYIKSYSPCCRSDNVIFASNIMHLLISFYILAFLVTGPLKTVEQQKLVNA